MNYLVYGQTGCGKSHLIFHRYLTNKKTVIVTTGKTKEELKVVGLQDIPVEPVSIQWKQNPDKNFPDIIINRNTSLIPGDGILGLDVGEIPCIFHKKTIQKISEWLENSGISEDSGYTIIFIGIPEESNDETFVKRLENWNANVVIEYMTNRCSIYRKELNYIKNSEQWNKVNFS